MRTLRIAMLFGLLTSAAPLAAQRGTDSVVVEVQNDRAVPVTVYLRTGQFDRRLARVPARQTRMLTVPGWAVQGDRPGVRLVVDPDGEGEIGMRTFLVRSGDRLSLQVPEAGRLAPTPDDTMSAVLTPEELEATTLTVDNPHGRAVTVFAEQGNFAVRLGRVEARSRATLRFPKAVVGPDRSIRVFVNPDGGADLSSTLLRLRRGEHLGLRVPAF